MLATRRATAIRGQVSNKPKRLMPISRDLRSSACGTTADTARRQPWPAKLQVYVAEGTFIGASRLARLGEVERPLRSHAYSRNRLFGDIRCLDRVARKPPPGPMQSHLNGAPQRWVHRVRTTFMELLAQPHERWAKPGSSTLLRRGQSLTPLHTTPTYAPSPRRLLAS